jgi:hypothetical protein
MGTNFYRIPKEEELEEKKKKLIDGVKNLDIKSLKNIVLNFNYNKYDSYEYSSVWDDFLEGNLIHLGKRSSGWRFLWNFNKEKYYQTKEELFKFIKEGRVIDEYGEELESDQFIDMALEWCKDGLVVDSEYFKMYEISSQFRGESHYDLEIEGLRVSKSSDFS